MTSDVTTWLVQEVSDLLDAGSVGLYEFIWLLRGSEVELSEEQLRVHAKEALDRLQLAGQGSLVWLEWPNANAVEGPKVVVPKPSDWADPENGRRYLALARI